MKQEFSKSIFFYIFCSSSMRVYLHLQGGGKFLGESCGARGEVQGGASICRLMSDYQQTLTMPVNAANILLFTYPQIGNYGVNQQDNESAVAARGAVMRELCGHYANFRAETSLQDFMQQRGVVGICNVDVRAAAKSIAHNVVSRIAISPNEHYEFKQQDECGIDTAQQTHDGTSQGNAAVLDFGIPRSQLDAFRETGAAVYAYNTPAEVLSKHSAVIIAGGIANKMLFDEVSDNINKLFAADLPLFGIQAGHALMAYARGYAVKFVPAHQCASEPVRALDSNKCRIQTHDYSAVVTGGEGITHVFLNSGVTAGIRYGANASSRAYYGEEWRSLCR